MRRRRKCWTRASRSRTSSGTSGRATRGRSRWLRFVPVNDIDIFVHQEKTKTFRVLMMSKLRQYGRRFQVAKVVKSGHLAVLSSCWSSNFLNFPSFWNFENPLRSKVPRPPHVGHRLQDLLRLRPPGILFSGSLRSSNSGSRTCPTCPTTSAAESSEERRACGVSPPFPIGSV